MINNFSPEAMRSPTKFIPETQAPTGDHGDDDGNRKMVNTAFKTPHGITSKDDEMRDTLIEEDEDDDYSRYGHLLNSGLLVVFWGQTGEDKEGSALPCNFLSLRSSLF